MKPLDLPQEALPAQGWHATLATQFASEQGKTVMRCQHSGPLRLQKALYPEGQAVCHAIIVHPPGGIASGDDLQIQLRVDAGAHALLTTPGAAKWYRKDAQGAARQHVHATVAAGGVLEWLPQEAIAFDQCDAHAVTQFELTDTALCTGWDVWVLGRKAHGEAFAQGLVFNHLRISINGVPALLEQSLMQAPGLHSVAALGAHHCCGVFWVAGALVPEEQLEALRNAHPQLAFTCPQDNLLLARMINSDPEHLMQRLRQCWLSVRPMLLNTPAQLPRIWST
jgi:urease accessory protein